MAMRNRYRYVIRHRGHGAEIVGFLWESTLDSAWSHAKKLAELQGAAWRAVEVKESES